MCWALKCKLAVKEAQLLLPRDSASWEASFERRAESKEAAEVRKQEIRVGLPLFKKWPIITRSKVFAVSEQKSTSRGGDRQRGTEQLQGHFLPRSEFFFVRFCRWFLFYCVGGNTTWFANGYIYIYNYEVWSRKMHAYVYITWNRNASMKSFMQSWKTN